MTELTDADALVRAGALLQRLPPALAPVRAVVPAVDHGWCFVVYWTLADSEASPPPGHGPIVVLKTDQDAFYLGSHDLESELARARGRSRPGS